MGKGGLVVETGGFLFDGQWLAPWNHSVLCALQNQQWSLYQMHPSIHRRPFIVFRFCFWQRPWTMLMLNRAENSACVCVCVREREREREREETERRERRESREQREKSTQGEQRAYLVIWFTNKGITIMGFKEMCFVSNGEQISYATEVDPCPCKEIWCRFVISFFPPHRKPMLLGIFLLHIPGALMRHKSVVKPPALPPF